MSYLARTSSPDHAAPTIFSALILLALIGSLLPLASPARAADTDWPQYRHDTQRSGRTSAVVATGGDGRLHLQWAYSLGERVEVEVEPIVAEGKVFLGAMNGVFSALNAATGALAWEYSQSGPIPHTAAYSNGRVFFGSLDGYVYALSAADGHLLWKQPTGGPVYAAPAVAANVVYIGSTAGRFFAFDVATGAERWRYPAGAEPLASAFTGAAALSPDGSKIYVGNEDMLARALSAVDGALIWQRHLTGTGMRSTHPVVSDDGAVVFFQTTKPGVQSYVPTEDYPGVAPDTDPVTTWNRYYQTYPARRATFFLNAATGAELWSPGSARYVPFPIPNWGILSPVLGPEGDAWFPTSGGAQGPGFGSYELDHDSRLIRINLSTGEARQAAGHGDFQQRPDENGRATFSGGSYLTTISEDLGSYTPATGVRAALAGSAIHLFGSHMDPLAPLPSKHLWRYGGVIAMGGVPGASPPVVAGGLTYYTSYGWLFAFGPTNQGKDPGVSSPLPFPARDERRYTLTYPRSDAPSLAEIRAELERRVDDFIAAPRLPVAKFEQAGGPMLGDISTLQVFGMPEEQIRVLAYTLPYLSPPLQQDVRAALRAMAERELFDPQQYTFHGACLVDGQPGIQGGAICDDSKQISARWFADNELIIGERLYAMAAYAEATGDWALIEGSWPFIKELFAKLVDKYNPQLGIISVERWHVGKLGIASQIGAAAGMLRMATKRGDTTTAQQARTLLQNLLATRVRLGHYVQGLYDAGKETPITIRIDADGVPNTEDIFRVSDLGELIPLTGDRRRDSDTRQVNWYDGTAETHSATGFMYYAALPGFSPLYPELAERLKRDLLAETRQYVQSYEVNAPWWWMNDLAHHTTAGGEHLWHSPTLAHDLFQVKAKVLEENWDALRHQLPLPMSINPRYDLHRIENLATLVELSRPTVSTATLSVFPKAPTQGTKVRVSLVLGNSAPITSTAAATITLPSEMMPMPGSATTNFGSASLNGDTLTWHGDLSEVRVVTISVEGQVNTTATRVVTISARINAGEAGVVERSTQLFLNGRSFWMPAVWR